MLNDNESHKRVYFFQKNILKLKKKKTRSKESEIKRIYYWIESTISYYKKKFIHPEWSENYHKKIEKWFNKKYKE